MNTAALILRLKGYLAEGLSHLESALPHTSPVEMRAPTVHVGALPPPVKDEAEAFPFVIVRPASGTYDPKRTTAQVNIVCGVHTPEDKDSSGVDWCEAGTITILDLKMRVVHLLASLPLGILEPVQPQANPSPDPETGLPAWEKAGARSPVTESFQLQPSLEWTTDLADEPERMIDPSYLTAEINTTWSRPGVGPVLTTEQRSKVYGSHWPEEGA